LGVHGGNRVPHLESRKYLGTKRTSISFPILRTGLDVKQEGLAVRVADVGQSAWQGTSGNYAHNAGIFHWAFDPFAQKTPMYLLV
jgi:hypothetical protein